jgi:hypothetical protein
MHCLFEDIVYRERIGPRHQEKRPRHPSGGEMTDCEGLPRLVIPDVTPDLLRLVSQILTIFKPTYRLEHSIMGPGLLAEDVTGPNQSDDSLGCMGD